MIHENRQKILQYLKDHNIEVTPTIKKTLSDNQVIFSGDYIAFLFGDEFIERFFKYPFYSTDAMRKFLYKIPSDITTDEFWFCVNLIIAQNNDDDQKEVVKAALVKEIREDKEILEIIANQDNFVKKHVIREAALIKEIREDKKLFNLIANQDSWEKQEKLKLEIQKILEAQKNNTATKGLLEETKNILKSVLEAKCYAEFMEWYEQQADIILGKVKKNYSSPV